MTPRDAYEADVKARPTYDNGKPRATWGELGNVERGSWELNPTPRWITPEQYKARRWYEIGTRWETCPTFLYVAEMDGHTRDYLAGCYARLFGVSLSPVG